MIGPFFQAGASVNMYFLAIWLFLSDTKILIVIVIPNGEIIILFSSSISGWTFNMSTNIYYPVVWVVYEDIQDISNGISKKIQS